MKSYAEKFIETPEGFRHFQQERLVFWATERICELMDEQGLNQKELARRLGKSQSYVSKLLNGGELRLRALSDVFLILGRTIHLTDMDKEDFNLNDP